MSFVEGQLYQDLVAFIEKGRQQVAVKVNQTMTFVFWQVGRRINQELLGGKRAAYGQEVVEQAAKQLADRYGRSFEVKNLRRMMQFADQFPSEEIVVTLSRQLSWSHVLVLLPIKSDEARLYYIQKIAEQHWSVRYARQQIAQKAFERSEVANVQLPLAQPEMQHHFKDPYFLDFLGLKEGYLENDLEAAVLKELERFILELGKGFTFVERQKRIIIDGEDFYLDLLFYHRRLRRLVAVELKIGKFKASYKGQMELYLKWLAKHDRQAGEELPIGLILCAEASSEQVELLEMHKDGIMVAEYWTDLPPKQVLEQKIHQAMIEAKERMAQKKLQQ